MLFPTLDFGIFFLVVFFISWTLKENHFAYKIFLTCASYFFYGYWDWRFTFLLFGCSVFNYFCARFIQKTDLPDFTEPGQVLKHTVAARLFLILAIIVNLGVLAFFKYYLFLATNLNTVFLFLGLQIKLPILFITLPVGISFFTFQALSYTIDVYRKKIPAEHSFINILLYISFFPQLVAGPIVRASNFLPQIKQKPDWNKIEFNKAAWLISFGLFKKVILANYLGAELVDPLFANPQSFEGGELLLGAYAYAVQIFCDFSAYSDIAIGVALLFGYQFPLNFNNPYQASSIKDFWQRWHISLSTWLRDYLYIPLGGNRKGQLRTYFNLLLTMLLGGLWHGAAWNFLIWGLLHGSGLILERMVEGIISKKIKTKKIISIILKPLGIFFTFNFVGLGWIFFRAPNLNLAWQYLTGILLNFKLTDFKIFNPFLLANLVIGLLIHFIPLLNNLLPDYLKRSLQTIFNKTPLIFTTLIFVIFLLILSAFSPNGVAPFIYFQF